MRARQQRNFIATLMLSQGVPMLLHGDELGRTQQGNNNGYAQDNELTWVHWDNIDQPLIEFTAAARPAATRASDVPPQPVLQRPPGATRGGAPIPDIAWLRPDGTEMQPEDWDSGFGRAVGVFLNGDGIRERDRRGEPIADNHFIVLFNAGDEPVDFKIPAVEYSPRWDILVDTAGERADVDDIDPGSTVMVQAKAMLVLIEHQGPATEVDHSVAASLAAVSTTSLNLDDMPSPSPKTELPELGSHAMTQRPASTYRLQIRTAFDLDAAAEVVPYLRDLGVSWAYLSPLLKATEGSDHGYDVVDPTLVDPARGGVTGSSGSPRPRVTAGLGILIDTVPEPHGHLRARTESVVVGRAHPRTRLAIRRGLRHRLGLRRRQSARSRSSARPSTRCIAAGDVTIDPAAKTSASSASCASTTSTCCRSRPEACRTSADLADPRVIREVIERQHWEPIFWRREAGELNYRRFFAVTTLAGVRVEVPWVFDETHAEILRWVREGLADGLRIDHPDGLLDPGGYLERLAAATGGAYVLVEKILEHGEQLPAWWETDGTTGYDALAEIDRVLIDPDGAVGLAALDAQLRDERRGRTTPTSSTTRSA